LTVRSRVDRALQERHGGRGAAGEFDPGAGDLHAAADRIPEGGGPAAAVGGRGGVRVQQADQGLDVLAGPGLLEGTDDAGLLRGRDRRGLRRVEAMTGGGRQLAARRRGTADDPGHLGKGVAENIVEDERDPFGRGHRVEHDQERHADRLVQGHPVGGVGGSGARLAGEPPGPPGQRLGDPFAHVGLPPGPR
jgi:hypothetical protein